ncbi:MAG: hypothetical protein ACQESF_07240, partial [Nanobdellota archaeon]
MKEILSGIFVLLISFSSIVCADDNDMFETASASVEPNVLIIFDTSGSMDDDSEYENSECEGKCSRIYVAKQAIKKVVDDYGDKTRIGLMRFNYKEGGAVVFDCTSKDNYEDMDEYKSDLKLTLEALEADGSTPLAETLGEAGRYFMQKSSLFNDGINYSDDYGDPFDLRCRNNYVILMTDGKPQHDNSDKLKSAFSGADTSDDYESSNPDNDYPYYYKKNHPRIHDISAYLYENDLRSDRGDVQNVLTYTIGFFFGDNEKEVNLLQDTADRGQGKGNNSEDDDGGIFVSARSPEDLGNAFKDFFKDIEQKDTTFESAATPISDSNKAYTDDRVYLSMFNPKSKGRWNGNIKKYKLNHNNQLCSADNDPITDSEGNIK